MGINYDESCRQLVDYIELRITWVESNYADIKTDKNKYYLDRVWDTWDSVDESVVKDLVNYKIYINYILDKMDK